MRTPLLSVSLLALTLLACASPESERYGAAALPAAEVRQSAQLGAIEYTVRDASVKLFSLHCTNRSAATAYVTLFQAADASVEAGWPGEGGIPQDQHPIPAGGSVVITDGYFGQAGQTWPSGLTWAISTIPGWYFAPDAAAVSQFDCAIGYQ